MYVYIYIYIYILFAHVGIWSHISQYVVTCCHIRPRTNDRCTRSPRTSFAQPSLREDLSTGSGFLRQSTGANGRKRFSTNTYRKLVLRVDNWRESGCAAARARATAPRPRSGRTACRPRWPVLQSRWSRVIMYHGPTSTDGTDRHLSSNGWRSECTAPALVAQPLKHVL